LKTKALWHIDSSFSAIEEEEIMPFGDSNVLIKAAYSYISLGTEKLVGLGLVPETLNEVMRVNYMGGNFDLPVKYGYSMVGSTEDGRRVHLMHPHQQYMYAKETDLFMLPDELPSKRAVLLSNMETTINAVWDARLTGFEKILIVGFGGIGALLALTLKYYAHVNPSIKEVNLDKINQAQDLRFDLDNGEKYDVIFHTSATAQGLQYAIDHVKKDGSIIELSWYGSKQVNIDLGGIFHYNRARLIGSQVSTVSPFAPVKSFRDRKDVACQVLMHIEFDALVQSVVQFENTASFYNEARKDIESKIQSSVIDYCL
jgi:threonine dehydrogenase-like Zn-dependent dehydrogenase